MDDLTDKLQSLLSDPESMRDLAELAAMLRGDACESAAPEPPPDSAGAAGMPDLTKLLAVGQALSGMQQDENTALLLALKPHLSAERQAKVGRAVRMLKLWNAASVLRENGMLSELLGGP